MPASTKFSLGNAGSVYYNSGRPSGYVKSNLNNSFSYEQFYDQALDDSDSLASGNDNDSEDTLLDSVKDGELNAQPGRLPDEVYERTLAWWRAGIRRVLVNNLEWESALLARMQEHIRTPWLDTYFLYSSSLGTHTFFMTALPIFFFFGYQESGRGLVFVLALGVYLSSFIKDLVCAPRPFAPPVTRLTIGSHHLEYGFPSTHSTNSVSVALFIYSRLSTLELSPTVHIISLTLLLTYVTSIVFGRLYTGMHSLTDCAVGTLLGTIVWLLHEHCWGPFETWIVNSNWIGAAVIVVMTVVMVNQHPQPVDDCPCFEDAIAFVSVVAGILLSRWSAVKLGFDDAYLTSQMPGTPWFSSSPTPTSWAEVSIWHTIASLKLFTGILAIFAWRLLAKILLLAALPPTFRALAHLFTLPSRRFYTPATEYARVKVTEERRVFLHPIPSVVDLPGELRAVGEATGRENRLNGGDLKARGKGSNGHSEKGSNGSQWQPDVDEEKERPSDLDNVKHYDADVITKVIVYAGIATLASTVAPVMFELVGWGIHP